MSKVTITHVTDPACPIAFSAEPRRMRIAWLYRDQLTWELRPLVLTSEPREFDTGDEGFTHAKFASFARTLKQDNGMPIDLDAVDGRERIPASIDACRAIVAATLHGARGDDWRLLQQLRRHYWTLGEPLDADGVVEAAAADAGIEPAELRSWLDDPATQGALHDSMELARTPAPAARVLDNRLSDAEDGRRRYSAPSWELRSNADQRSFVVPGFMHFDAYEVALANLDPSLERRDDATSAEQVLEWAQRPLALAEIASIRGTDLDAVRSELASAGIEPTDWVSVS